MAEDEAGITILRLQPRVPNNYTFSTKGTLSGSVYIDGIKPVIDHWHGGDNIDTKAYYIKSETKNFNPKYQGDRNSTRNFRDYGPVYIRRWARRSLSGWQLSSSNQWRVPSGTDFLILFNYIKTTFSGIPYYAVYTDIENNDIGKILKSCRQINSPMGGDCNTSVHPRWEDPYLYGDGEGYGVGAISFNAFPNGEIFNIDGRKHWKGKRCWFWTDWSDEVYTSLGEAVLIQWDTNKVTALENAEKSKKSGLSVRLVRDITSNDPASGNDCEDYVGNNPGNPYNIRPTVRLGNQVWLKLNLAETTYRNGDNIYKPIDGHEWTDSYVGSENTKLPMGFYQESGPGTELFPIYNEDPYVYHYGLLYNGYAVDSYIK